MCTTTKRRAGEQVAVLARPIALVSLHAQTGASLLASHARTHVMSVVVCVVCSNTSYRGLSQANKFVFRFSQIHVNALSSSLARVCTLERVHTLSHNR